MDRNVPFSEDHARRGLNMLVRPLSRTDEVIEDEHVSHVQSLSPFSRATLMDKVRHVHFRYTINDHNPILVDFKVKTLIAFYKL